MAIPLFEIDRAKEYIDKFVMYCSNITSDKFIELMYGNSRDKEYIDEKLFFFRRRPFEWYSSLDDNMKFKFIGGILKKYKEVENEEIGNLKIP